MPALTRRRNPDARQESWLILYGDVHVGTIGLRSGNPFGTDPWQWRCGFYPGSEPGDCTSGAVARLVGIEVGVVSGVFNLESPGVSALGWRLRHEEAYHAA
jgi:hypothetical protein